MMRKRPEWYSTLSLNFHITPRQMRQIIASWIFVVVVIVSFPKGRNEYCQSLEDRLDLFTIDGTTIYSHLHDLVMKLKEREIFSTPCTLDLTVGVISVLTDIIWRTTVAFYADNIACKLIKYLQVVTPKFLGGPPVDRDLRNAHPGYIQSDSSPYSVTGNVIDGLKSTIDW
ncbi:hypothetical protein TNCV_4017861 [Trichonephila clavipes]|nr:hypothetical protein TNCV_4017861 [Trichonephila clavipes]